MELPLFPLHMVLFPGMPLPIHVFEERYKLMVGRCLQVDRKFGVVLIKSGREVGEPAVPFEVGTVAQITKVVRGEDGRLNLLTAGVERFRIRALLQERPYLQAEVELMSDEGEEPKEIQELTAEAAVIFERYLRGLLALSGQWMSQVYLPQEPRLLSYAIAAGLRVDLPIKQELLEAPLAFFRLQREIVLLKPQCERVRRLVIQRWHNPLGGGFSLN